MEKQYLTALSIEAGIITLIDADGDIKKYRQRGITGLTEEFKLLLIRIGFLNRSWYAFEEIPANIVIFYEDEEILGRASVKYPAKEADYVLSRSLKKV